MEYIEIKEYFTDIETTKNYNGYVYSVADAITIAILGNICGLKNVSQIHQWASSERISKFLKEEFAIKAVPCYFLFVKFTEDDKARIIESMFCKFCRGIVATKEKSNLSRWENNSFDGKNGRIRKTAAYNQCTNKRVKNDICTKNMQWKKK